MYVVHGVCVCVCSVALSCLTLYNPWPVARISIYLRVMQEMWVQPLGQEVETGNPL